MRINISRIFDNKYIDFMAFDNEGTEEIEITLAVVDNGNRAIQIWATVGGPSKPSWFNRREVVMAEFYNNVVPVIKNSYWNNSEINEQTMLEGIIENIGALGITELFIDVEGNRLCTITLDEKRAYFPVNFF